METTLLQSFIQHDGYRGAHFCFSGGCRFLPWDEVVQFIDNLPSDVPTEFHDKLLSILSNYNPETHFLVVGGLEGKTTIELYAKNYAKQ